MQQPPENWHLDKRVPVANTRLSAAALRWGGAVETFPNSGYIRVAITGDIA